MFFDADGIIFDRKISPADIFEKTFENKPGGLIFGKAYFRENPVYLFFCMLIHCFVELILIALNYSFTRLDV